MADTATLRGEVYAKSGICGKVVTREEAPAYFWTVTAIHAGVAIALATGF